MPIHLRRVNHDPWADPNIQPVVFGGEQAAARTDGPSNVPVAQAKEMAKQGKNADTIFQATGWYRAPDSNWKYIIPDQGTSLNKEHFNELTGSTDGVSRLKIKPSEDGKPRLLGDILNHPELFKAYPQLKDTTVELLPDKNRGGTVADYNPTTNKMRLSEESEKNLIPTILHETQHNIQRAEGFAAGGSTRLMYPKGFWDKFGPAYDALQTARKPIDEISGIRTYPLERAIEALADKDSKPALRESAQIIVDSALKNAKAKGVSPEAFNQYVEAVKGYQPIRVMQDQAQEDYRKLAGETESRQVEKQFTDQNWNQRPTAMPGFPAPSQQFIRHDETEGPYKAGTRYNKEADKEALPTTPAPFDPWDSGRSLAPTDIAPLTDVSQGIRDYARDVVTGEVARRGLEYYNQNPMEAGLALSGGGLSVKGAGPNVIPLSRPRTYEAAQGDARAAIAEPRGYALDIGERGAEMAPFGTVPEHSMSQPRGPAQPLRPGEALPEGTTLKPLEPTNTNAPTYPIAGGYRLMPAFTKKDQWSIIDPRGEIMFRSPDKATTQTVFDFVNKGTTGLAVGGGALAAGDQAYAGQRSGSQNYLQVVGEAKAPYPKDVQDFYDYVRSYPRQAPGQDPNWILNNVPSQQALGYDLQEVYHDPFTPETASQVQPRQIPFTPPQAISTLPWSFGNNAPDATPTRFSDIAPPLNYYQPLSNTNGVPTYGG